MEAKVQMRQTRRARDTPGCLRVPLLSSLGQQRLSNNLHVFHRIYQQLCKCRFMTTSDVVKAFRGFSKVTLKYRCWMLQWSLKGGSVYPTSGTLNSDWNDQPLALCCWHTDHWKVALTSFVGKRQCHEIQFVFGFVPKNIVSLALWPGLICLSL